MGTTMTYRIIVSGDGIYATRGGRLAFISGVDHDAKTGEIRFPGYMHVIQGHTVVNEWHIWRPDGRYSGPDLEHEFDIIGVV